MAYYFSKTLEMDIDDAVRKVGEELRKEGFGILTEIDMQDTLKKKLNADIQPYRILGACNPGFAYKALQTEDKIGTMLPCNVVVREVEAGKTEVSAVDPVASMMAISNPALITVATEVRDKLKRVIDAL